MEVLKELVQNILTYYIILSVLMALIGKSSFKKYIEMFSGIVMIIIILNPLIRLFKAEDTLNLHMHKNQFYEITQAESEDIVAAELMQSDAVLRQYEETIAKQVCAVMKNYDYQATDVQVTIDQSVDSDTFGEITNIEVCCKKGNEVPAKEASSIKQVEIPDIKIETRKHLEKEVTDTLETKDAMLEIANMYGMDASDIKIKVEEEKQVERE